MQLYADAYAIPSELLEFRAAGLQAIYEGTNEIQRVVIARAMR